MGRLDLRAIGLPTSRCQALFPSPANACSNRPSAESCESVSFPRVASPLRSFFVSPPCCSFRSCRPAGGSSLFAASPMASTVAGLPRRPLRSVLRFSQPLDGFRHHRLRGLIASRGHVQGSRRSGDSPAPQPSRLVAGPCLRAVAVRALTGEPAATLGRLDFEALLRGSMRSSGSGFSPSLRSLPSAAFSSLRCSLPAVDPVPRGLRS